MRQIMSTALVALIVGAVAGGTMGAMAQAEPAVEQTITPAARRGNADRVDGRHAVGFTNMRGTRAGKLVATNKGGWLPSNIVQPLWHLIKNKPAGFADGVDNEGVTGLVVTRRSANAPIGPNTDQIITVSCPSGWTVVGGGAGANTYGVHNVSSQPEGNGWYAHFENTDGIQQRIFVFAICLSTEPAGMIREVG